MQAGVFRLAASVGVDPLVIDPAPKLPVFLGDASDLASWNAQVATLPNDAKWARYERAPVIKGGRFATVLELFVPALGLDARQATPMREVLSLPER